MKSTPVLVISDDRGTPSIVDTNVVGLKSKLLKNILAGVNGVALPLLATNMG